MLSFGTGGARTVETLRYAIADGGITRVADTLVGMPTAAFGDESGLPPIPEVLWRRSEPTLCAKSGRSSWALAIVFWRVRLCGACD